MCFVVVVIGGIGSARGALVAAMLVGLVDIFGKALLPQVSQITDRNVILVKGKVVFEGTSTSCMRNPSYQTSPGNNVVHLASKYALASGITDGVK